ncbi:MAG: DNA-processing protein DprA [bacterium]|nr:DNA-processing protein DprA [bacterium]
MTDLDALVVLNHLRVGPITARRLIDAFGSPAAIFKASAHQLATAAHLSTDNIHRLQTWEHEVKLTKVWQDLERENIRLLTYTDTEYPALLKQIYDYPLLLYVKGTLQPQDDQAIAIVGTRTPTGYGRAVARKWASQLAARGFTIVSGLARGIDTQAHWGALDAKGRTIAVLGYGFGYVYPKENAALLQRIIETGAAISEYPYKRYQGKASFPLRNRLIAGLSRATLVVESRESGGAMITAHFAAEYNRTVFALPGPITAPTSAGPHRLIREGATLVRSGADILEELGFLFPPSSPSTPSQSPPTTRPSPPLEGIELQLYQALVQPLTLDELAQRTDLSIDKVTAAMLMLELKGLVRVMPGKIYDRK